jgi:hypothetical protein
MSKVDTKSFMLLETLNALITPFFDLSPQAD